MENDHNNMERNSFHNIWKSFQNIPWVMILGYIRRDRFLRKITYSHLHPNEQEDIFDIFWH